MLKLWWSIEMTKQMPELDSDLKQILQAIRDEKSTKALFLVDLLSRLVAKFDDEEFGKQIISVISRQPETPEYSPGIYFSQKQAIASAVALAEGLGFARQPLTPEIVYFGCVDGLVACWTNHTDATAVRALRAAGLCLSKSSFVGDGGTSQTDGLGASLTAAAQSWSAPPLGAFDVMPKSIRQVLVQLFAGYQVPLLVGEPGVGKSTIARQIAYMLLHEYAEVHPSMHRMQVFSVSRADLVAGTSDRGDLETKVQQLVSISDRKTANIVFLDEIHAMFDGSDEAKVISNILKPPMAEGKLRCFGATTRQEFDKYLTSDPPLLERFKLVSVQEPERDSLVSAFKKAPESILSKSELDGWNVSEEAIEAGVDLSIRFMPLQRLPRKAANLLRATVAECRFESSGRTDKSIRSADVQRTIKELIGLPDGAFDTDIATVAGRLATKIKSEIKGHDSQIDQIATHICSQEKLREFGFQTGRPIASFILAGSPGIGKRALVNTLAKHHFAQGASPREFVSEAMVAGYEGEQGLNRFRGSAPGFVGFGESPPIFREPRSSPRRVVLIEGLDSSTGLADTVHDIITSGIGYDGAGRKTDFSNCILIALVNQLEMDALLLSPSVDFVLEFVKHDENALRQIAENLVSRSASIGMLSADELLRNCKTASEVIRAWRSALTELVQ